MWMGQIGVENGVNKPKNGVIDGVNAFVRPINHKEKGNFPLRRAEL